ncbi:Uncharacterised protein [Vibrio cholerae]|nr:Uncharacterised protein [Vibrio cholerae]
MGVERGNTRSYSCIKSRRISCSSWFARSVGQKIITCTTCSPVDELLISMCGSALGKSTPAWRSITVL